MPRLRGNGAASAAAPSKGSSQSRQILLHEVAQHVAQHTLLLPWMTDTETNRAK